VLLVIALVVGIVLAVPNWPDSFGGSYVKAMRQWTVDRGASLAALFSSEDPAGPVPDPVPGVTLPATIVVVGGGGDVPEEPASLALSSDLSLDLPFPVSSEFPASEDPSPEVSSEPVTVPPLPLAPGAVSYAEPVLPPLDARIFSLPNMSADSPSISSSQEPDVTIVEIAASPSLRGNRGTEQGAGQEFGQEMEQGIRRGFVSARSVRIRSAPDTSTNDNVVGWGNSGDRLVILEEGRGRDGSVWYRIRYETGNKQGWISGSLVTLEE
jgi:hypothetical protein